MKYIVMECRKGYAVLMNEDSAFVTAANRGYKVGQTVTDPILMESGNTEIHRKNRIVMSLAAAAACLVVMCGAGYHYYAVNYKPHSTVIISSNAGVKMYLNKKDKVIKLESVSPEGEAILSDYSGKGKDKSDAISDILEIGKSKGYIADGDTVSVFIPDNNSLKKEIEDDLAGMSLKADIQPIDDYSKPTEPADKANAVKPDEQPPAPQIKDPASKPEPPEPAGKAEAPVLPTAPSAPPADPPAQDKKPEPPTPPAADNGVKPEPPTAPEPHSEPVPPDGGPALKDPPKKDGEEPKHPDGRLPHEKDNVHPGAEVIAPAHPKKPAAPEKH